MHALDWAVVLGFSAWIVYDGLKRTKDSHEIEGYFLANRSIPWWAAGISVMATQLSAITMIGTTGQGYTDGLRFIQFYFALPARDGHPVADAGAVLLQVRRLHRLRVSRAAFRREDAQPDERALSRVARHVVRRGDFRAGGRAVAGARLGPDGDGAGDRVASRGLHDVRRRSGRDVDRREDHGPHRLWSLRRDRDGSPRACPPVSGLSTA